MVKFLYPHTKIKGSPVGLQYENLARFFPQDVHIYGEEIWKSKNTFVNPATTSETFLKSI
jgi:hypothetical protein